MATTLQTRTGRASRVTVGDRYVPSFKRNRMRLVNSAARKRERIYTHVHTTQPPPARKRETRHYALHFQFSIRVPYCICDALTLQSQPGLFRILLLYSRSRVHSNRMESE